MAVLTAIGAADRYTVIQPVAAACNYCHPSIPTPLLDIWLIAEEEITAAAKAKSRRRVVIDA